ncbi:MAG: hypothetical protein MZV70_35760 [Desulfobacterales bacterium]|nr:hypothetical protein [Desulfobacterales bacterium]
MTILLPMKRKWILDGRAAGGGLFRRGGKAASVWAEVGFAVGTDVTILRDGKPLPGRRAVWVSAWRQGDQVQTGKGTFLELAAQAFGRGPQALGEHRLRAYLPVRFPRTRLPAGLRPGPGQGGQAGPRIHLQYRQRFRGRGA